MLNESFEVNPSQADGVPQWYQEAVTRQGEEVHGGKRFDACFEECQVPFSKIAERIIESIEKELEQAFRKVFAEEAERRRVAKIYEEDQRLKKIEMEQKDVQRRCASVVLKDLRVVVRVRKIKKIVLAHLKSVFEDTWTGSTTLAASVASGDRRTSRNRFEGTVPDISAFLAVIGEHRSFRIRWDEVLSWVPAVFEHCYRI